MTHQSLIKLNDNQIHEELLSTQNAILATIGDTPETHLASSIVRPPFGDIDDKVQRIIRDMGFSSVRSNSDRYDWQLAEHQGAVVKERINDHLSFIKNHLENSDASQSIIDLNHDGSIATLSVLDEVIPAIKEAGYHFVSLSECLGLKKLL